MASSSTGTACTGGKASAASTPSPNAAKTARRPVRRRSAGKTFHVT
jgi:hypothetical protein